jgi:hypothetical protein
MAKRIKKIYPQYVMMIDSKDINHKTALRNSSTKGEYYRDGGCWSVKSKWIGDELFSVNMYDKDTKHLGGNKLIECTYEEWKRDNEPYGDHVKDKSKNDYILLVEEKINKYNKLLKVTKQMEYHDLNNKIIDVLQDLLNDMKSIENNEINENDDIPF